MRMHLPPCTTQSPAHAAYLVANIGSTVPSEMARAMLQSAALEIYCPTLTTEAACDADAWCSYDAEGVR
jgi:hypothetical protein